MNKINKWIVQKKRAALHGSHTYKEINIKKKKQIRVHLCKIANNKNVWRKCLSNLRKMHTKNFARVVEGKSANMYV